MIVPKFTIRHILIAMTVLAALSLLVSFAVDGQLWAIAICIGLASAIGIFALHGLTFVLTSPTILLDAAMRMRQNPTTPFATAEPPPQIVPPQEPE